MEKEVFVTHNSKIKLILLVFLGILSLILSSGLISSQVCYVDLKSNCQANGDYVLMGLSSSNNAHGEVSPSGGYNYGVCCNFEGGSEPNSCNGNNKFVGLSSITNAHAETPSLNNYDNDVCYGGVQECFSVAGNCAENEVEVLSLSSTTNAHIGNYARNVCCRVSDIEGGSCTLTDAYWSIDGTNPINSQDGVEDGVEVSLIVEGTNCEELSISFEVFEYDEFSADDPASINPSNVEFGSNNRAVGLWDAEYRDDEFGNPEYYFVSSLVLDALTSINSQDEGNELLSVTQEQGGSDGTTPGDGNIEPGEECDDGNLINGDGCSDDMEIEPGWQCTNEPSECELIINCNEIVTCGDYTEEGLCTNDDNLCDVASNGIPESLDCEDGNIACICSWDSAIGTCESSAVVAQDPEGENLYGTCTIREEQIDENGCADGLITIAWSGTWVWAEENPEQEDPNGHAVACESDGTRVIECPAQVQLPFFGFPNLIAAVVIVALVYVLMNQKGNQRRKKN